jgi:anti-sigma factor RsiW
MSNSDDPREPVIDGSLTPDELLPDLAAGRLDDVTASRLRRALATDAALAEEYAIIEAVRRGAESPVIDVGRIVAGLPRPPQGSTPVVELASRRATRAPVARWQWRAAAAVLVMVAGAGGVLLRQGASTGRTDAALAASIDAVSTTLASSEELDALSDDELVAMLARLEQFDGGTTVDTTETLGEDSQ